MLGQEVGRKYYVYKLGEKQEILCTVANAAWDAATNLKTITKRVTSGLFKDELLSVKNPDGTLTHYSYSNTTTNKTTTVDSGQSNGSETAVIAGTRTVTVVGLAGELVSHTTSDIASGATTAQEIVNPTDYDDQKRPTHINYLDGTYSGNRVARAACGSSWATLAMRLATSADQQRACANFRSQHAQ